MGLGIFVLQKYIIHVLFESTMLSLVIVKHEIDILEMHSKLLISYTIMCKYRASNMKVLQVYRYITLLIILGPKSSIKYTINQSEGLCKNYRKSFFLDFFWSMARIKT